MEKLKHFSLFSGIESFKKALTNLGIENELVGYSEFDKYASVALAAIHGVSEELNYGDITKIDEANVPDCDLITYGFPCQDISVAGLGKGIIEGETRSGLLYDALRIIKYKKPKYAIAENVKNLVGKKFKNDFEGLLVELESYGYNNYWQVLNAKDYGIPQNRERVFVVSIRKDIDNGEFLFPKPFDSGLRLRDVLEPQVDDRYYIQNEGVDKLVDDLQKEDTLNNRMICAQRGRYDSGGKAKQQLEIQHSGLSNTLTTVQKDNLVIESNKLQLVGGIGNKDWAKDGKWLSRNYPQGNRIYDPNGIACSQTAQGGGIGSYTGLYLERETSNEIQMVEVQQLVRVRRHDVDTERLVECLRDGKSKSGLTNRQISEELSQPITMVEHWFRRDNSFSIPDPNIWYKLKQLLEIATDEFDVPITEFEEKEGVYEKGNRYYHEEGIAPTITTSANERVIVEYKVRKLTPLECWRLMGFDDEDYFKAKKALEDRFYNGRDRSNSQMYKMAGNSIVVDVLEGILKNLIN